MGLNARKLPSPARLTLTCGSRVSAGPVRGDRGTADEAGTDLDKSITATDKTSAGLKRSADSFSDTDAATHQVMQAWRQPFHDS